MYFAFYVALSMFYRKNPYKNNVLDFIYIFVFQICCFNEENKLYFTILMANDNN